MSRRFGHRGTTPPRSAEGPAARGRWIGVLLAGGGPVLGALYVAFAGWTLVDALSPGDREISMEPLAWAIGAAFWMTLAATWSRGRAPLAYVLAGAHILALAVRAYLWPLWSL